VDNESRCEPKRFCVKIIRPHHPPSHHPLLITIFDRRFNQVDGMKRSRSSREGMRQEQGGNEAGAVGSE